MVKLKAGVNPFTPILAATSIQSFPNGPLFIAQAVNVLIVLGLFTFAARAILKRGRGWEVPLWLLLAFFIPVIFPVLALIHFRKSRFDSAPSPSGR